VRALRRPWARRAAACCAALVAIIPLTGAPASAQTAAALAFRCTAILPSFPSPADEGTCGGTGNVTGGGAKVSIGGTSYVISGLGTLTAQFAYDESCVAGPVPLPPLQGVANGQAHVGGLTAVGSSGTVRNASIDLTFNWNRTGAVAVISITGGELHVGGADVSISGTAEAVFVPIGTTAGSFCPEGGPLEALVAGTAQIF
jgi:hypothetical protein